MTELIHLKDCYVKEFDANVIDSGQTSDNEFYCVLDRTAFYPEGGGQNSDTGYIEFNSEKVQIFKVSKKHDEIKHWSKTQIPKGSKVHGVIDWEKRHTQMRLHTAQHLLSAIALNKYGAETVGNQIKESESRIDLSFAEWSDEIQNYLETEFNKAVGTAHKVHFEFVNRKQMEERVGEKRRKLFERLPEFIDNIRLVIIEGIDIDPCVGTHVKNTNEIGHIHILRTENKGSGIRRIYYKLEKSS